jgi:hypothetical protein
MTRSLDPSLQHLRELGGFRRQFVQKRAEARGEEVPRMLRSFVDFLFLYGHFVSPTALTTTSAGVTCVRRCSDMLENVHSGR